LVTLADCSTSTGGFGADRKARPVGHGWVLINSSSVHELDLTISTDLTSKTTGILSHLILCNHPPSPSPFLTHHTTPPQPPVMQSNQPGTTITLPYENHPPFHCPSHSGLLEEWEWEKETHKRMVREYIIINSY
jgi:hypothetical protein